MDENMANFIFENKVSHDEKYLKMTLGMGEK